MDSEVPFFVFGAKMGAHVIVECVVSIADNIVSDEAGIADIARACWEFDGAWSCGVWPKVESESARDPVCSHVPRRARFCKVDAHISEVMVSRSHADLIKWVDFELTSPYIVMARILHVTVNVR